MKRYYVVNSILVAGALFGKTVYGAAPAYSLQDLGVMTDLSNRTDGQPNAISSDGRVAASYVSNDAYHPFVFDGQWNDLGTLGGQEGVCADVNALGLAVGNSQDLSGNTRAFLWTPGGVDGVVDNPQMKDLGTLGGTQSEAYSINSSGQISGYAEIALDVEDHAFVSTEGSMTDIGVLLGGGLIHSYGLGINESGHVVGVAYSSGFAAPHAFYYDGGTAVDIGNLGGTTAEALDINDADQIAGYSADTDGFEHAFRYVNSVMTDLGTLGGGYSYSVGINNSGVIVGGSFVDAANTVYHAFVCNDTTMTDLNELIDATGTGWILTEARGINDSGQIVGIGQFEGVKHAFLLNPLAVEPAPSIAGLEFSGNDLLIRFTTVATADYVVEERSDFESGTWSDVVTAINGTGDIVTTTVTGAAGQPSRYYRVRLSPR